MLDKVKRIIDAFNKNNVEYIIIGGYAVILHGFLRATEDLDIIIKLSSENVAKLQHSLKTVYDDSDVDLITYEELAIYPVIRYGTPDNFYIDIISSIGELFSYEKIEKNTKVIDGIKLSFASASSLYEMKKNTYLERKINWISCF